MSEAPPPAGPSVELPVEADAFEAFLRTKTALTPEMRRHLDALEIGDLRNEARRVNEDLQALASAIALSVEEPRSLGEFFGGLEPGAISHEHDWHRIFARLKTDLDDGGDRPGRRRSALINYMQFLSSLKHRVDDLVQRKAGLEATDAHANVEAYLALQARMRRREREREAGGERRAASDPDEFARLAVGDTVTVRLPPEGELEILLAGHQFKLVVADRTYLRDLRGVDYELLPGRNVVGRHPDCEVVLPGDLRNISRAHLLIERADETSVNLTDLSSKGTFLPAELLVDAP